MDRRQDFRLFQPKAYRLNEIVNREKSLTVC